MPPKLKATSSKRKLESNSDESNGEEGSTPQKALPSKKPRNEKSTALESSQPTNKTLPDSIVIPPKEPGTMRIVAWNVSGYAASAKKVNITLSDTFHSTKLYPGIQSIRGSRERRYSHHNRDESESRHSSAYCKALLSPLRLTIAQSTSSCACSERAISTPILVQRFQERLWYVFQS